MSEEIKVNRPVTPRPEPVLMPQSAPSSSKLPWIVLAVVVVVVVVLGVLFRDKLFSSKKESGDKYQAVFLTNGQVYFGQVSKTDRDVIRLKDIFYLQVIQQQPLQGTPEQQQAQANQQPQISLVKLGQELHGPVDEMYINRSQVLFWEDLKSDGRVVQAIKEYKANPQGSQAAPQQQQQAAPQGQQQPLQ